MFVKTKHTIMYQKITKEIKEEILNLSKEILNIKEIAKIVNMNPKMISYHFSKLGIKSKNQGYRLDKNHNFFETIDSEIKAYLLGYFVADGCVSIEPKKREGKIYSYNKRICLMSSIDDEEVIKYFQEFISPHSKIIYSNNQSGVNFRKTQCILKISSKKLVEDLCNLNIHPRKTYDTSFIFDFNLIPEHLHSHFIRGFFDGDGGLTQNNKSIQFCFTSFYFCNQLKSIFENLGNTTNICSQKSKNMIFYQLTVNGGHDKISIIYDYLYKNANFFLKRKFNKFKIDNTVLNKETNRSLSV